MAFPKLLVISLSFVFPSTPVIEQKQHKAAVIVSIPDEPLLYPGRAHTLSRPNSMAMTEREKHSDALKKQALLCGVGVFIHHHPTVASILIFIPLYFPIWECRISSVGLSYHCGVLHEFGALSNCHFYSHALCFINKMPAA